MKFTFDTVYGQKAMTAMAKALRKTLRKKRSRRSHIFGWIVLVFALALILPLGDSPFTVDFRTVATSAIALVLLCVLIWEDQINGYFARKRMLKGTDRAASTFQEDGYCSTTEFGKTEWTYDKIELLAETKDYFVFLFRPSHAQLYDKRSMTGGTLEEFRAFIQQQTGKKIEMVK